MPNLARQGQEGWEPRAKWNCGFYINPGPSKEHVPRGTDMIVKFSSAGAGGGARWIKGNNIALEIN